MVSCETGLTLANGAVSVALKLFDHDPPVTLEHLAILLVYGFSNRTARLGRFGGDESQNEIAAQVIGALIERACDIGADIGRAEELATLLDRFSQPDGAALLRAKIKAHASNSSATADAQELLTLVKVALDNRNLADSSTVDRVREFLTALAARGACTPDIIDGAALPVGAAMEQAPGDRDDGLRMKSAVWGEPIESK